MDATTYNYRRFDHYVRDGHEAVEFGAFPDHLHVGDPAPSFEVTTLDGDRFDLAERWRRRDVVLEFGSFT